MGETDRSLKNYFRNEECADFINAVNFDGKQVIKPEDFIEKDPIVTEVYEENEKIEWIKRERDFFRMVRVGDAYYIFIGVEQQSQADPVMPLRVAEYDILAYSTQYKLWKRRTDEEKEKAEKEGRVYKRPPFKLIPVITYVVLWSEEKWIGPKTLKEMMDKEVLEQIQKTPFADMLLDYEIKVFTPNEQENFDKFKSSLHVIFEALVRRKDKEALNKYMRESNEYIDQATADVINALTGTKIKLKKGEDTVSMRMAFDELVDDWKAEGREEGREEGRNQTIAVLIGLYEDGILTKTTLLTRAKDGGILDDVLKQLDIAEKKKPSTGRKL